MATSEQENQVILWHRRLEHLGQSNLSKLTSLSEGMQLSSLKKA